MPKLNLTFNFTALKLLNIFLIITIFSSALLVIYFKHQSRQLFSQIQVYEQNRQQLQLEWSQLLLEQATLGGDLRVEKVARENLNMHLPDPNEVIVVR